MKVRDDRVSLGGDMVEPIVRKFVHGDSEDRIEVLGPHLRTLRTGARSVWDDHAMAVREAEKRARKLKREGWIEVEGGEPSGGWNPAAKIVEVLTANNGKQPYVFGPGLASCHQWTEVTAVMEWHVITSDDGTRGIELRVKVPTGWSDDGTPIQPIDAAVRAQVLGKLIEVRDEALSVEGVRAFPLEPIHPGGFDTLWVLGPLHNLKEVHPSIERSLGLAFPGWSYELREQDGVAVAMARCQVLRYARWDRSPAPAYRARFDCRPGIKKDKKLLVWKGSPLQFLKALANAQPGGFVEIENYRGELARFEVAAGSLRGLASGSPDEVAEALDRFLRPEPA